jgi:hypothetical protein
MSNTTSMCTAATEEQYPEFVQEGQGNHGHLNSNLKCILQISGSRSGCVTRVRHPTGF